MPRDTRTELGSYPDVMKLVAVKERFLVDSRNEPLRVSAVVYASDWAEPTSMASWGVYVSTLAVLSRLGGNQTHRRLLKNSYDTLRRDQLALVESALLEPMDRFVPYLSKTWSPSVPRLRERNYEP